MSRLELSKSLLKSALLIISMLLPSIFFGNATTIEWEKNSDMMHPRAEHVNAVVDGKIYVFGGIYDHYLCYHNVARFNSIIVSYCVRGLANIGGDSLIYTDNYISSGYLAGMMIATVDLGESKSRPENVFLAERNSFHKCGHFGHNHAGIHIYLKRTPMKDVVIRNNIIKNGRTEGVHIDNTEYGDAAGRIIFENNISCHNLKGDYRNASNKVDPVLKNNTGF